MERPQSFWSCWAKRQFGGSPCSTAAQFEPPGFPRCGKVSELKNVSRKRGPEPRPCSIPTSPKQSSDASFDNFHLSTLPTTAAQEMKQTSAVVIWHASASFDYSCSSQGLRAISSYPAQDGGVDALSSLSRSHMHPAMQLEAHNAHCMCCRVHIVSLILPLLSRLSGSSVLVRPASSGIFFNNLLQVGSSVSSCPWLLISHPFPN
jgi:hypothetical protein